MSFTQSLFYRLLCGFVHCAICPPPPHEYLFKDPLSLAGQVLIVEGGPVRSGTHLDLAWFGLRGWWQHLDGKFYIFQDLHNGHMDFEPWLVQVVLRRLDPCALQ